MNIFNPSPSVSPQYVENISGAIVAQITTSSGVSQGTLASASGALNNQISSLSGQSIVDGVLSATTNGPATRLLLDTYNNANTFGSSYRGRRARGSIAISSGVLKDDVFLQLVGDGHDGSGFVNAKVSYVMFAAENWSPGAHGTYATIRTTPTGSAAVAERVRFAPDGNVGIGNDSPQYRLDISGALNVTQGLFVNGVAVTGGAADTTQTIVTPVPTGISSLFIPYQPFQTPPFVTATIDSVSDIIYQMTARQVSTTGYMVYLSDTVTEPGVTINTLVRP